MKVLSHLDRRLLVLLLFITGVVIVATAFAAIPAVSFEAESGTLSGVATNITDGNASGGQAVRFAAGSEGECPGSPGTPGGADPWGGCWPGPQNTGIAGCPPLTTHNGTYRPGTGDVVENLLINGQLLISGNGAHNITIRCVKVVHGGYFPVDTERGGVTSPSQILLDRVEVDCGGSQVTHAAFLLFGTTLRRGRVYNCADAFRFASHSVIEDSYCGDLYVQGDDANEWHYDCSQTGGGENMTIRHNSLVGKDTSDVALWPDIVPINNVLVERNLLIGTPGYKIYVGKNGIPNAVFNVTVRENRFGRGGYGPCSVEQASPTWTGNVWNDTGATIPLSSC